MFPVEASRELQIRIFHRLGTKQYVLTLHLQSGDDVQSRVLDAFQQGRLPCCLYRSTLEYAVLAVRESLCDHELPQLLSPSSHSSHLVADSSAALGESLVDLEERQWPRLISGPSIHPFPGKDSRFWCAYDFLLRHRPTFFRTIGTLEESYSKGIRDLQAGRLAAISELQRCQSIEMEKKRQQAEEITEGKVDDAVSLDVRSLVAQHVSEIDAVELHWQTEIEQLKIRQRASYCDLVVDSFEQEIQQIQECHEDGDAGGVDVANDKCFGAAAKVARIGDPLSADIFCSPQVKSSMTASPPAPLAIATQSKSVAAGDESPSMSLESQQGKRPSVSSREPRLQECAEVRALFGQRCVFFVLRLWVGDIMDIMQDVPSAAETRVEDDWAPNDFDGAGPQLPPELLGLTSYGHSYFARASGLPIDGLGWPRIRAAAVSSGPMGAGIGISPPGLQGQNVFRSASLRFWEAPTPPSLVHFSPNAYARRLRGLVIPTPENLKFDVTHAVMLREFAARCERVTDLHFPALSAQLELVRSASREPPLRTGDYFCTRHSNLGGVVQAAFHLLTSSSDVPGGDEIPASMHRALKRIVCDCHRCNVAQLSLPLLLLDIGTSESSLPYAVAQRRAENVLRALKGALTRLAEELAPSELPGLQVINLVLPLSCAQSVHAGIPSVVQKTLTFLQNSFQCV